MSIIVILNFAVDDDDYIYFSVQQCTVMKTILFYCRISFLWICCLCSTCCTETFQRKQEIPFPTSYFFFFLRICLIPLVLSSWYPVGLTYSLPVTVAVIESRHGTTHCLNTVDHSRWRQETHLAEKNGPEIEANPQKRCSSHPDRLKSTAPCITSSATNHVWPCVNSFLILQWREIQRDFLLCINDLFLGFLYSSF